MPELRYIHAADLHLDTPFTGISRETGGERLTRILQNATFTALDRLVLLCENHRPHFVLLAGDIYNQENASIKSQLKMRDACRRLHDMGIPVFIAHGNHDPLSSRFQSVRLPENTHIFSAEKPEIFEYKSPDGLRALIHGMSHQHTRESRNLATLFQKQPDTESFQVAVLHCAVENTPASDRYAPCTLNDLKKTGLDAWALGHVHERRVLCQKPFIAYSGNTQGLHINETGSRGCFLMRAIQGHDSWTCEAEFLPLAPVEWNIHKLNLEGLSSIDELGEQLGVTIEEMLRDADAVVQSHIARFHFTGRTALNDWLRQAQATEDVRELLSPFASGRPSVWLKDLEIDTHDERDADILLARDDLLGETMRIGRELSEKPEELEKLRQELLAPILSKLPHDHQLLKMDEQRLKRILDQATYLCQDVLEGH